VRSKPEAGYLERLNPSSSKTYLRTTNWSNYLAAVDWFATTTGIKNNWCRIHLAI